MQQNRLTGNISSNPWTNKSKVRGEGVLNAIMNKYLHDQQQENSQHFIDVEQRKYAQIANKINAKFTTHNIMDSNLIPLFELKKRCKKIDQVLQWIQKIEQRSLHKAEEGQMNQSIQKIESKTTPIDSSFVYLPLHSGTIFHQIVRDCTLKDKRKGIGQYRNPKLKQIMDEITSIQDLRALLQKNIL